MAELDKVPTQQQITIEQVKIEEETLNKLKTFNGRQGALLSDIGSIYIRKKELHATLEELDKILEKAEDEFRIISSELKDILDDLDDKYPQARINLQDGYLQYQPGSLSRKQLAEQQEEEARRLRQNS